MVDVKYMKEYLRHAATLERFVYVWNNALKNINVSISKNEQSKKCTQGEIVAKEIEYSRIENDVIEERKSEKKDTKYTAGCLVPLGVLFLGGVYGYPFFSGALDEMKNYDITFVEALKRYIEKELGTIGVVMIVAVVAFLLISLIAMGIKTVVDYIKRNTTGYWKEEARKRQEFARKEKEKLYNAIAICDNNKKILVEEKNKIIMNLRNASDELVALYSKNILPEKYRNLIAVTTMYEYLSTGRCTAIEGHGGIIDTYEYDCKLGLIINNLMEINYKMDIIAANQQMLHEELCIANSHLQSIQADVSRIENHTGEIAKNSAVSAIANQQTAAIAQSMELRAWYNGF